MSGHTPGPWQVSPLDGRTCGPSRLLVQSGTTIAQMQAVAIVTLRTGETDANARLIAAAPELLDLLRRINERLTDGRDVPEWASGWSEEITAALQQADSTLVETS